MLQLTLLTLPGRPITKKNSQKIIVNKHTKRPMIIQSDKYRQYERECLLHLAQTVQKCYEGPVALQAQYWMPDHKSWPDLIGLLQATSDILQKAGVIKNDKYIIGFDGSKIVGVDKQNPRVEIALWRQVNG